MFKKISAVIIGLIVILFVIVGVAKNVVLKKALSAGFKAVTGLQSQMESMTVEISNTLIGIKGLKIFNPEGFSDRVMADIPEISLKYDLVAFLRKKVHFEELRLNLKELIVVKNEQGKLNLNSLKVARSAKEKTGQEKAATPELKIDRLRLTIGKVVYKDYSNKGTPPSVQEFNINIDKTYRNITDASALVRTILNRALINTGIETLVNLALMPLKKATQILKVTPTPATETVKKEAEKVAEEFKDILSPEKIESEAVKEQISR